MGANNLLSRLHKVRQTGSGRWIACCPAHGDKSPSLAIREIEDGRVLLHCFANCETGEVLAAVGLTFNDLFPETAFGEHAKPERRPWISADVLRCLAMDALVILQCANVLRSGTALSEVDQSRLTTATTHFQAGERICHA
jgi:hypothetical protein